MTRLERGTSGRVFDKNGSRSGRKILNRALLFANAGPAGGDKRGGGATEKSKRGAPKCLTYQQKADNLSKNKGEKVS